jgi:UDP-N-acetylmuramyl tripeptide synthase
VGDFGQPSEISAGLTRPAAAVEVDRRRAIERLLGGAQPGDIVLIAGKGHETYQILGTSKHHFDDREEAMRVLGSGVV